MSLVQDLWSVLTSRALPSTATANSLANAVRTLSIAAAAGNPAASSALDRLLRQLALSSGDAANSLSKLAYDNLRLLRDAALDGTEIANSIGRMQRQMFAEATAAPPVANSMADRIISGASPAPPPPVAISPLSQYSIGGSVSFPSAALISGGGGNWGANVAALVPFWLPAAVTVVKILIENGGTKSGNVDVGIYGAISGSTASRIVSSGSTPQGNINTIQVFDIVDQALSAGTRYYMALAADNASALYTYADLAIGEQTTRCVAAAAGCFMASASFPLPATITVNATWSVGYGAPFVVLATNTNI